MKGEYLLGISRITLGLIFLWAFIDKIFGFGFSTPYGQGWFAGTSPTKGFLMYAVRGPFASIFNAMSGGVLVDIIFMTGLLLIGLSLIFGIFNYISSYSGILMLSLMYLSLLPPEHHPFIDEHILYILFLLVLLHFKAGNYIGFGKKWSSFETIKKNRILW